VKQRSGRKDLSEMPTIHWLGAGLSSVPGIRRLAASGRPFVLWNRTLSKAQSALDGDGQARELNWDQLSALVQAGDVVVSMLPADLHMRVAELCLQTKAHFVSSSYISPAMRALDTDAQSNDLCFVNEVGLDPGIDHLMAHVLMADYQASGVMNAQHQHHFRSYCGGFPSQPNDFRYKFSWSPLGVLRALKTPARWIEDGTEARTDRPWKALSSYSVELPAGGQETFQAYPNRDSIPFAEQYGFPSDFNLQTFVRGTLRLGGWAEAWQEIFNIVDDSTADEEQLKMLSDRLWKEYAYDPEEPDRVILHVEFTVTDGQQSVWSGTYALDEHGNTTGSAMARLVSKTVSIAVESVMDGELMPGVSAAPSNERTANAWLARLSTSGERIVRT